MEQQRDLCGAGPDAQTVVVRGVRLAYEDSGSGPAVVCLHAIGHGVQDFSALRERIGAQYRIIALDWPGQGRSADDAQPVTTDRYVELLRGFLQELQIELPIIIGCSIGGATAIRYAAQHPEAVRGLVLCDPGGLNFRNPLVGGFCRAMAAFFRAGVRKASWYPRAFRMYYGLVLPGTPAREQRERIIAASTETASVLDQAWRHFAEPESDVREDAASLQCQVLFAWAKHDRIVAYWQSKRAVQRVPNHRVEFFTGGHAAFLEDPDAFTYAFKGFASTLPEEAETCPGNPRYAPIA